MTRKSVSRGVIGLVFSSLAAAPGAFGADLGDEIGKLTASAGKMKMSIRVEALGPNPSVVYEYNAGEPLQPASVQKIVTTAAALSLLSPDFTYRTILAVRGEDLVIIGAGDPSCGDPRMAEAAKQPVTAMFHAWADRLKAAGLVNIHGNLIFDDSIFDDERVRSSWEKQKFNPLDWYSAPVGGLNFNDNCVDVLVRPATAIGSPAEVTLVPGTSWISLQNTTKTAKSGQPLVKCAAGEQLTLQVSGSVSRANSPGSPLSVAIPDPGMFFASACRTALSGQGITINGQTKRARIRLPDGALPPDLKTIAVHETKLTDVLWRANKCSVNMFGEAILKTVGAYAGHEAAPLTGSYQTGQNAVQRFLESLNVPRDSFVIDDGSGLSHGNRISAAAMTAILRHMNDHPLRKEWLDSLAVPGEKAGTLRRRMKDLAGKVFAKTGHIDGVSALSGYVIGPAKQVYAFSILCNDKGKAKIPPNDFQDSICRKLATWGTPAPDRKAK